MRCYLVLLTVAAFAVPSYAQDEIVSDTLDWRGYYPLEIGNAWEWETEQLAGYHRLDLREIVGDTLMGDTLYFIQAVYWYVADSGSHFSAWDTTYVRHDSLRTRVVALSLERDAEEDYTCDLSAAFGSEIPCTASGEINAYVDGEYTLGRSYLVIGGDSLGYNARKLIYNIGSGVTYYHGAGALPMIGDGAQGGTDLTYVRVGETEYGNRQVFVSAEHPWESTRTDFAVYPNPAHDELRVLVPVNSKPRYVRIYDILGREALRIEGCSPSECRVDTGGLSAGLYFLRVEYGNLPDSFKSVVVLQ